MNDSVTIRPAEEQDRAPVNTLLIDAGLVPLNEEAQFGPQYALAVSETGEIVATAGVEVHGAAGLLRSVVVRADLRSHGLGARLAEDRIRWAAANGLTALYLLTDTAAEYWPRFGFAKTDRSAAPTEITGSFEWRSACPASATAMKLEL